MRTKDAIRADIEATSARLAKLRFELQQAEAGQSEVVKNQNASSHTAPEENGRWPLPAEDYKRYGRQMIMPEIGLQGQLNLRQSSVLIVGLGGLGCPAAAYLAGAGVNRIGLIDGDTVELSNLHRQILHTTARIGLPKVHSAVAALQQSNPDVDYEPYTNHLTPKTALDIFSRYDLILDCTDHPTSRYLISDAAVLAGKPLVSASALRTDGQLVVLNYPPTPPAEENTPMHDVGSSTEMPSGGPCYRCIFPKPPPPDSIVSCGEGGILGPVVGTMGVLMALEALKVITTKAPPEPNAAANLLIFSAYSTPQFRNARMKGKRADCQACGQTRTITAESLNSGSLDYIAFCGVTNPVRLLDETERISPGELVETQTNGVSGGNSSDKLKPTVIDVREKVQFELASMPGSINIPFSRFESGQIKPAHVGKRVTEGKKFWDAVGGTASIPRDGSPLVFVCRLGNDSQVAARKMQMYGYADDGRWIGDLRGGLRAWRNEVEPDWPDF